MHSTNFNVYPFVKVFVFLSIGIILSDFLKLALYIPLAAYLLLIVLLLLKFDFKYEILKNAAVSFLLVITGYFMCNLNEFHPVESPANNLCELLVSENSNYHNGHTKCIAQLTDSAYHKAGVKVVLNDSLQLIAGDRITISKFPQQFKNALNPYEFDYKKYMAKKNIFFSVYLNSMELLSVDSSDRKNIYVLSFQITSYIKKIFSSYIKDKNSESVCLSLLLGIDDELGDTIKSSYSITGVIHLFSVSGMHVGFLYLLLNLIINSFFRTLKNTIAVSLLIVAVVMFYVFITGMSPSASRAGIMISVYILSCHFKRGAEAFNVLFAAGVLLLLFNPYTLYDIGFQYSMFAVIGILLFNQLFKSDVENKNKIRAFFEQLLYISLAAQLFTFPLSIYYFNSFSNYFLLSNLLIIPLATIAVYLLIALLVASVIPFFPIIIGVIINKVIIIINSIVVFIAELPYAALNTNKFYLYEVVLIYILLFMLLYILRFRLWKQVKMLLFVVFSIILARLFLTSFLNNNAVVTFYSISNTSVFSFKSSSKCILFADVNFYKKFRYNNEKIKRDMYYNNISETNHRLIPEPCLNSLSSYVYSFSDLKLLFVNTYHAGSCFQDYYNIICVAKNALSAKQFNELKTSLIVFDNTNSDNYIKKMIEVCMKNNLEYYVLKNNYAKVISI